MKNTNTNNKKALEVKACMATIAAHFLNEEFEAFLTENWERMEQENICELDDILNLYLHPSYYA